MSLKLIPIIQDPEISEDEKAERINAILETDIECLGEKDREREATPLHWAIFAPLPKVIDLLIKKGADVSSSTGGPGYQPIHIASMYNKSASVISILVEAGADVNAKASDEGSIPLNLAFTDGGQTDVINALLEQGADIKARNENGSTPLNTFAENGIIKAVKILLAKGADVNTKCNLEMTPLINAASEGHLGIVKLLVESGANLEERDDRGNTALAYAAFKDKLDVFRYLLLDAGADLLVRSNSLTENTVYQLAVESNDGSTVKDYLDEYIPKNCPDREEFLRRGNWEL